ncbi:MAG TPA: hypothetical protein DCR71_04860 [Dehalococcoidia bacterium]|jgi:hypothetical protein|nr:hypothetical protein [Dehalococcoidia bacterium]HAS27874.1 hypothetical protein [Dehalococcoidia bacterium]
MLKPIKDATQLKPVVLRAVKALYGQHTENITILKAELFPLFREPKQGWMTHVEFNDDRFVFNVQLDVQMDDGTITRVVELNRNPLQK